MPRNIQTFDDDADQFDTADLDTPWGDTELRDLWEAAQADVDVELQSLGNRRGRHHEESWDDLFLAA